MEPAGLLRVLSILQPGGAQTFADAGRGLDLSQAWYGAVRQSPHQEAGEADEPGPTSAGSCARGGSPAITRGLDEFAGQSLFRPLSGEPLLEAFLQSRTHRARG